MVDGIISAVTTMQKESNDRFCEIEEKRMRLDEKIMELEHRRWMESQDREERQWREERFQATNDASVVWSSCILPSIL